MWTFLASLSHEKSGWSIAEMWNSVHVPRFACYENTIVKSYIYSISLILRMQIFSEDSFGLQARICLHLFVCVSVYVCVYLKPVYKAR